jgi:DnaJ family protein C protein 8
MSDKPLASSTGNTPVSSSNVSTPAASSPDIADIEKLLNREASAFQREVEVERILKSFKLK